MESTDMRQLTRHGKNHPVGETPTPLLRKEGSWKLGRVGMLYRDLTPDGLKSRVIVSHIRLPFDGEVPDYVHYHKVDFQMIYCKKGRIKVVYEDQGAAFWLETGDCVLQPPEIRHRVLECTTGAEVIEVTMPSSHETCVEHDITLPTNTVNPLREFNGQRFVRHIAAENAGKEVRDLGISAATGDKHSARVEKLAFEAENSAFLIDEDTFELRIRLNADEFLIVNVHK